MNKASCDFVLKNHDIRVPLGFKYLREEVKAASEQLDLCITTGDWETAKEHQQEFDRLSAEAELEEQLYLKSIFCLQHAENRYAIFLKKRDLLKLEYYSKVKKASDHYLSVVPHEDKVGDIASEASESGEDSERVATGVATAEVVIPGEDDSSEDEAGVGAYIPRRECPRLPALPRPQNCFSDDDADNISSASEGDMKLGNTDSEYQPTEARKGSGLRSNFVTTGTFTICVFF